jgi:hypothetical protein
MDSLAWVYRSGLAFLPSNFGLNIFQLQRQSGPMAQCLEGEKLKDQWDKCLYKST